MSAFARVFYFIRDPHAGTEDVSWMHGAGAAALAVNVGDFPPEEWELIIRPRALQLGMRVWPWARIDGHDPGIWYPHRLNELVAVADRWNEALIVNAEKGLDQSDNAITRQIAEMVGPREAALSVEAVPFSSTDWGPLVGWPVLPQLNIESGHTDVEAVAPLWRAWGFRCVFPTFGTYGGRRPSDYRLAAPFNLYTADDCQRDYDAWAPTGYDYQGCQEEDDMQVIGKDDGVRAEYNALRDLEPSKTLLKKGADGKWPDISTLTQPVSEWKAWDKAQRRAQILVDDHDEIASKEGL